MPWKSTSKKRQPTREESSALRQLASVRRQRRPFERLSRKIISDTLASHLPDAGTIVEIGMGDGQLRERLPAAVLPRVVHTEPLAAASREFRKQHPKVDVRQASAERLPFGDGEVAAVIGLCVLDAVQNGPLVVSELRRVLRPGGPVLHWLDMSTILDEIFATLSGTQLIPLPNVFTDPMADVWPEDMVLVPRRDLGVIAGLLAAHGQALAQPLRQYIDVFSRVPFERGQAIAEFVQLQESSPLRSALSTMFRVAYELAEPHQREELAGFGGRPVSSTRHFENRLKSLFGADAGFRVDVSEIVPAWEVAPRVSFAYMSMSVGEQRYLQRIPDTRLCSDANVGAEADETLIEHGVHVFVATRI